MRGSVWNGEALTATKSSTAQVPLFRKRGPLNSVKIISRSAREMGCRSVHPTRSDQSASCLISENSIGFCHNSDKAACFPSFFQFPTGLFPRWVLLSPARNEDKNCEERPEAHRHTA